MSSKIMTLNDSLDYFNLRSEFQELEKSLEQVRKHQKSESEHEICVKSADKKMQKLCLSFHPDRIVNSGGSAEERTAAAELQTALNMTRSVLKAITREFLENLHIYYKYEFFYDVPLYSLAYGDEIGKRIVDITEEIEILSEIRREKIVVHIRRFLECSRLGLESYFNDDEDSFKQFHELSMFHSRQGMEGHKMLQEELSKVERNCSEKGLLNMESSIRKIRIENSIQLRFLERLNRGLSLDKSIRVFGDHFVMDEYFVMPFAYYVNVLSMCKVILDVKRNRDVSFFERMWRGATNIIKIQSLPIMMILTRGFPPRFARLYYLVSFAKGEIINLTLFNKPIEYLLIEELFYEKNLEITTKNAVQLFDTYLINIQHVLQEEFKLDFFYLCSAKEVLINKFSKQEEKENATYEDIKSKISKDTDDFMKYILEQRKKIQQIVEENEEMKEKLVRYSTLLNNQ